MNQIQVIIVLLLLFGFLTNNEGYIKFTNLQCRSLDKNWAIFIECRLRAKSRGIAELYVEFDLLRETKKAIVNCALMRKANGYKPFLYNITLNACDFMKRRNNPLANIVLKAIKNYTTLNHSCPYKGKQRFNGFYLRHDTIKIPFPTGEYAAYFTGIMHNAPALEVKAYFEVIE